MKRIFSLVVAFVMLVVIITPCFAVENSTPMVTPRYVYIITNSLNFSIDESTGVTTSGAYCCTYGNYEIQIICELQRYNNSKWNTLKTWTTSGMRDVSLTKSWAVAKGYTYRAYVTFCIYDSNGFLLESASGSKSAYLPAS